MMVFQLTKSVTAKALLVTQGTVASGMVAQTVTPGGGSDIVDYGLTAMIASSFFYLVYALATRKIVAIDTAINEEAMAKRGEEFTALIARVIALEESSAVREARLYSWLEGRAKP